MIKKIVRIISRIYKIPGRLNRIQESLGRIEARQTQNASTIERAEFRVFSQWGEDGIIQYLINRIECKNKTFIEFGVENYLESNTRFLLTNNGWSGLVIDGSAKNIEYIKNDIIYWSSNLSAVHAFITKENINELIGLNGLSGDIGLLSVDIDGNDYWVWSAINTVSPAIVIAEYNGQFGPIADVSVPYDPNFIRDRAHYSKVFYGASITALSRLAKSKGYSLVGGNTAGNNAFFVRNDLLDGLKEVAPIQVFQTTKFREFHDNHGKLTFHSFNQRYLLIRDLLVYDFKRGAIVKLREVEGVDKI